MDAPEWMLEAVAQAVSKHSDINEQVACAEKAIRGHEEFGEYQSTLVTQAIRNIVHSRRHTINVSIRRETGSYGGPAKVGGTGAAARVVETILDSYSIAGVSLGNILGEELDSIAKSEAERAEGHSFNAKLCRKLATIVPEGKQVRQAISASRMAKLFRELKRPKRRAVAA